MTAIPPELFELLNLARATVSIVVVALTCYYLMAEYRMMRRDLSFTRAEAISNLRKFRLAIGTIIAFSGEFTIAAYIATVRLIDKSPMPGRASWPFWLVAIPAIGTAVLVIGGACIARSIIPRERGRVVYWLTFLLVAGVVIVAAAVRR